jgi:uncharacterized membrane protein
LRYQFSRNIYCYQSDKFREKEETILTKTLRYIFFLVMLFTLFAGFIPGVAVKAQASGILDVSCDFPTASGKSGDAFDFVVKVLWQGSQAKVFNLTATTPPGWQATILRVYTQTQIGAMRIDANRETADTIGVNLTPVSWYKPDPGEYPVTVTVASEDGQFTKSFELKAVITAKYQFVMEPVSGRFSTEAVAGEDNVYSVMLKNTGATAIQDVIFSSDKPENWSVIFTPGKVSSLEPGTSQQVDVIIKPPRNRTIAGDYVISLSANSKEYTPDEVVLKTSILTPPVLNWTGIFIVVAVVGGLAALFWQLSQR